MHFGVRTRLRHPAFTAAGTLVALAVSAGTGFLVLLDDRTGERVGAELRTGRVSGSGVAVSADGESVAAGVAERIADDAADNTKAVVLVTDPLSGDALVRARMRRSTCSPSVMASRRRSPGATARSGGGIRRPGYRSVCCGIATGSVVPDRGTTR